MRTLRDALLAIVCLGFTARATWADPAQEPTIDDPYAPHVTRGTAVRLGTAVGFLYDEPVDAIALGLVGAVGQRFGRLTVEAELGVLSIQARGGGGLKLGDGERLGALARYDLVRLDSTKVGPNSMLAIYVEGGAAVAWNHWYRPGPTEPMRTVPQDTKRVEGQAGFGLALDHRRQGVTGFPQRIGWFLGWRIALAPEVNAPATVCRGTSCRTEVSMPSGTDDRLVGRSMLFQSSFLATW